MEWQRARSENKKNERREAIFDAATTLFQKRGYENVSLNAIAAEAKFTKSNMYRYFSSREEIFLNIFSTLFESWVDDCVRRLRKLDEGVALERFAKVYVESMKNHKKFLDLTPLLFTSLERNSSFEQLVVFKTLAKNRLQEIAAEVCRIFPVLSFPQAFTYLDLTFAATKSYWAASTENEALKKIYAMPEFKELRTDFETDLSAAIPIILRGLGISKT